MHAVYLAAGDAARLREVEKTAERTRVTASHLNGEALDALARGGRHQGVVAITGDYPYCTLDDLLHEEARPSLFVALDEITDPQNLGAIVRSAAAFGAHGVIIPARRAAPVTPVAVRAAAGATEWMRIARVTNLVRALDTLRDRGLVVTGLHAEGAIDLAATSDAPAGRVLVVGAEGKGLRRLVREHCDELARIPMSGPIASLNASAAAAIALYELTKA